MDPRLDPTRGEIISITKNQALGFGGLSVGAATLATLMSMFLTRGDGDKLQLQIDANTRSISEIRQEIDRGFVDVKKHSEKQFDRIADELKSVRSDRWTRADHEVYSKSIESRIDVLEDRVDDLSRNRKAHR